MTIIDQLIRAVEMLVVIPTPQHEAGMRERFAQILAERPEQEPQGAPHDCPRCYTGPDGKQRCDR